MSFQHESVHSHPKISPWDHDIKIGKILGKGSFAQVRCLMLCTCHAACCAYCNGTHAASALRAQHTFRRHTTWASSHATSHAPTTPFLPAPPSHNLCFQVYRGLWNDTAVAIKVIEYGQGVRDAVNPLLEASLSKCAPLRSFHTVMTAGFHTSHPELCRRIDSEANAASSSLCSPSRSVINSLHVFVALSKS